MADRTPIRQRDDEPDPGPPPKTGYPVMGDEAPTGAAKTREPDTDPPVKTNYPVKGD